MEAPNNLKKIINLNNFNLSNKIPHGNCRYCNKIYGYGYYCDHYHSMTPRVNNCFPKDSSDLFN